MGIVSVVLSYSRGALLGLVALLLVWALKSKYKVTAAIGFALVLLVIFAAAPGAWIERMQTLREAPESDPSAMSRIHAWQFARDLAKDHPFFGGGFQTFTEPLFAQYSLPVTDVHGPHSIYFQMLGEHGFPGLIIFLTLIVSCYLSCRKLIRRFSLGPSPGYLPEYARMVQLSLIPFLVSGAFLGRAYFDLFYQLIATVIILKGFARDELAHFSSDVVSDVDQLEPEAVADAHSPLVRPSIPESV